MYKLNFFLCLNTLVYLYNFFSMSLYFSLSVGWILLIIDSGKRNAKETQVFRAGSGCMFYFVIFIQTAINTGVGIGAILLAGECLKVWPSIYSV